MKSLAKNSIYNMIYQVLNLIFPLISSIYVARILSPEGVGRVAHAQNIASYFVTAAALGIPTIGVRVVSVARDDQKRLNREFSELFFLNAILTTIALVAYSVVIWTVPGFRSNLLLHTIAGLSIAFNYLNIDWLYSGQEEYVYIVIRSVAVKVLSILALFLFVKTQDDYIIYLLITCLAICGNYLFNVIQSRKLVSLQFRHLSILRHIRPVLVMGIALFLNGIYSQVDTTMLGVLSADENIGYYSYAHKVLQIAIKFCTAVTSAFLPRLSYYFENDRKQFDRLLNRGVQLASFLAFPAAVGLFLLAPEVIELLFGAEFLPAAKTLRCFAGMILISAFGNLLCYQMMICSGNETKLVPILSVATCLNITLNALMIPHLQEQGAAIASVCTELFINGVEIIYIKSKLKINFERKPISQGAFSAAIMGAYILIFKQLSVSLPVSLLGCIFGGVIIYVFTNILLNNSFTRNAIFSIKNRVCPMKQK